MNAITAKSARWVILTCLFIIPFLSLVVTNNLFFPFITGKNFAFRILVDIAVAAYIVLIAADARYRPKFSWTYVIFKAFAVWMFIADCFAVNAHKAFWSNFERMDGWVTLVHIFMLFVIAGSVLTVDKLWRNWWLTFLSGSALVSLYGFMQLIGAFAIHQGSTRLDATLGNAEYLAAYLLFAVIIGLWQAIESKGWLRWTLGVLVVLEVVVLYYTQTRGAVVALGAAVVIGSVLWMLESGKKGRKYGAAILAIFILCVGGLYLAHQHNAIKSDSALNRITSIAPSDLSVRFTLWHMAWEGFLARPVVGWGQEGYNYVFNQYYSPTLYGQEAWFDRAHNAFLDWLVAGGLPAFLLFVALLVSAVLALYRRKDHISKSERILLITVLAAYAVQALVLFDNLFTYVPLVMLLAMAHSASAKQWKWKFIKDMPEVTESQLPTVVLPIAFVVGVLLVWFVNVPNVLGASDLITALSTPAPTVDVAIGRLQAALDDGSFASQEIREQIVQVAGSAIGQSGISDQDKIKLLSFAITQMQQQIAVQPLDARLRLQLATLFTAGGDFTDARTQSAAAHLLSPNKQGIIIEEGTEAVEQGDYKAAQQFFQSAYQLDTSFDEPAVDAAAGNILAGNTPAANALLLQHFGTTTVDNNLLQYAYLQTKQYPAMIAIWQLRVNNNDTAANELGLAQAYLASGQVAKAQALLQSTVAKFPEAASQAQQLLGQPAARAQ